MKTNLDALLTALYVHLDDQVLPWRQSSPQRGRPRTLSNAELVCVAVAQVLLGCDAKRRWLRLAPARIGHLFPRLPCQAQYNRHLRTLGPVWVAVACWLARATPTWHERLRLMDGTPVRCGASRVTANRSSLGEIAGYGHDTSHHAFYWGAKLMLVTIAERAVCAFSLAHPKELDERKQAVHLLHVRPPAEGPCPIVCDKGFAGAGIEAVIWTLKNQLGLERHRARTTDGLWTRISQRIVALNAAIWHNWLTNQPIKRSLIAYDH
ncbi:hypothetical protein [Actinomadura kijaniata]|uniref:hypothetical protein n=1 Tax=Actinomadura kijaniata TaxID=46161 RepID=UPI00082D2BE0|nr:hypothetical protein [Actinomadura kijaniata]